ncbi:MAG TPA: hypothetical protein VHB21_20050, partial [Minicystis sp.]|nr:hypothetical protein [Minicystis sp.]
MITIQPGSTMLQGSTLGGGAHAANGCASDAPDQVYALTMGASGFLTASLARMGTSFDSVLWISKACSDQASVDALLCNDSQDPNGVEVLDGGEVVSLKVAAGETYYLVVDGKTAADAGDYQLVVDLASGRSCQDPVPIPLAHGTPQRILGSNANQPMNTQGSCGGVPGGDVVYKISTDAPGTLTVATSSLDYNAVLYARSSCGNGGSELDCSNSGGPGVDEQISVDLGNTTTGVTVYVDGSQIGGGPATGSYALVLTPP